VNRRPATAATLAVVTMLLTGCGGTPSSAPKHHAASSDPSPAAASASPVLNPTASVSTPLGAGERVWAAFAQRGVAYNAWWARLKPLLSDSAQAVYAYDDPRNIPEMKVTGKVHVSATPPARPGYTAEVVVPTSKGVFGLDLERHTLKSPWLLYAIRFPSGVR
jgi:hypothetical protein